MKLASNNFEYLFELDVGLHAMRLLYYMPAKAYHLLRLRPRQQLSIQKYYLCDDTPYFLTKQLLNLLGIKFEFSLVHMNILEHFCDYCVDIVLTSAAHSARIIAVKVVYK